jgi:hypothetical protein
VPTKKKTAHRSPWSKEDVKELKSHSKARTPVAKIAKAMKRTEGALRRKAGIIGIGLARSAWAAVPGLVGKEMREPQHHAEAEILLDLESTPVALHQRVHVGDLRRQRHPAQIGDIAVKTSIAPSP